MHIVTGTVEHGDRRGRKLGFPTANIAVSELTAEQEDMLAGVWAGVAQDLGTGDILTVTVSMGRRPTFYGPEGVFLLEAFVLDFPVDHTRDLYGRDLSVHLCHRLRGQRAFSSIEALVQCMENDVMETRMWRENNSGSYISNMGSLSDANSLLD